MNQFQPPTASPGIAAVLEICFGLFLQTFGVGHIYTGRVVRGLFIMLVYWTLQGINFLLYYVFFLGVVTAALTCFAFMIISPIWAASTARRS